MSELVKSFCPSPIGFLEIVASDRAIHQISYLDNDPHHVIPPTHELIRECAHQLEQYFSGSRMEFDIPVEPEGSGFDKGIWNLLIDIHYGTTISYKSLSLKSGNIKNIRAVGGANARNPIPIIIPCHRVIGEDGNLTGYAGGLKRKKWLLQHEGVLQEQLLIFRDE